MSDLDVLVTKTGKSYLYVDLTKVEAGTKIHAYTANSKYTITTKQKGSLAVRIEGGKLERPRDICVYKGTYNAVSGNILNSILCENLGFKGIDRRAREMLTTSPVRIVQLEYPDGTQVIYWGTKIQIENSIFTDEYKLGQKHPTESFIN